MRFQSSVRLARLVIAGGVICGACSTGPAAGDADQAPPKVAVPARDFCTEPRPQLCMEIYMPVCGFTKDGHSQTYPNSCHACAHAEVIRFTPGKCGKN